MYILKKGNPPQKKRGGPRKASLCLKHCLTLNCTYANYGEGIYRQPHQAMSANFTTDGHRNVITNIK